MEHALTDDLKLELVAMEMKGEGVPPLALAPCRPQDDLTIAWSRLEDATLVVTTLDDPVDSPIERLMQTPGLIPFRISVGARTLRAAEPPATEPPAAVEGKRDGVLHVTQCQFRDIRRRATEPPAANPTLADCAAKFRASASYDIGPGLAGLVSERSIREYRDDLATLEFMQKGPPPVETVTVEERGRMRITRTYLDGVLKCSRFEKRPAKPALAALGTVHDGRAQGLGFCAGD